MPKFSVRGAAPCGSSVSSSRARFCHRLLDRGVMCRFKPRRVTKVGLVFPRFRTYRKPLLVRMSTEFSDLR